MKKLILVLAFAVSLGVSTASAQCYHLEDVPCSILGPFTTCADYACYSAGGYEDENGDWVEILECGQAYAESPSGQSIPTALPPLGPGPWPGALDDFTKQGDFINGGYCLEIEECNELEICTGSNCSRASFSVPFFSEWIYADTVHGNGCNS